MPIKDSKLRELFKTFRGAHAAKELPYIETAIKISAYVNSVDGVDKIKRDFSAFEESPSFKSFSTPHKKIILGSLLYGKLSLDNYLHDLPESPEKLLLDEVTQILGDLFNDANTNKDKLLPLLDKVNVWLNTHASLSPNKEKAHELSKGIYTMLTCLNIKMRSISYPITLLAGSLITPLKTKLPELMTETENTSRALRDLAVEERQANASQDRPMEELFNQRYLDVLTQDEGEQLTRFDNLAQIARKSSQDIQSLIAARQMKVGLEVKIEKLQSLLLAAQENNTRTTGRKYFVDFVASNEQNYNVLLEVYPEQTKVLETLRASLKQESGSVKSVALSLGSIFSSPFAVLGRKITPQFVSDQVSGFLPDTNDSLAKRQLVEMTNAAIKDLEAQQQTNEQSITALEVKFASVDTKLQTKIENADMESLTNLLATNNLAVNMVDAYIRLREPIETIGQKLKGLEQVDINITTFIETNDKWHKLAGDAISRFFTSIFSKVTTPSLSDKIVEARRLKQSLLGATENYKRELNAKMDSFEQLDAAPIKQAIKDNLESLGTIEIPISGEEVDNNNLESIKRKLESLTPQEPNEPEDESPNEPEDESPGSRPTT